MKPILSILVLLVSVAVHAEEQPTDFRNARWGMSKQEVKSVESLKFDEERDNDLLAVGKLAGLSVYVYYTFTDGMLSRGAYIIKTEYINPTNHIQDYYKLKELLAKKYGLPVRDETIWLNDLFQDDPQHWGTAISMGYLTYITEWTTRTSRIQLVLRGENFKINHGLVYKSLAMEDLTERKDEETTLDDL